MIVEATNYYARPGMAAAVLERRREGSRLRQRLGLPEGSIFVNRGGPGPDVRWECRFADETAFQADLAARDASPEFAAQRRDMGALTERFERHVFHLDTTDIRARRALHDTIED
ncbi:MAG: hypothetical protein M9939_07510 [Mesorhizobium sp.]|nr:hypothetical protein [Mesorhizobium sp.]MCO5160967.1 hypothetical protein [Mesorhizobium sp.]